MITKQPELYQPEAVAAAISLLQSRTVTQEESNTVEQLVKEHVEETKKISKLNPVDQFLLSTKELLQPVMTRGVKVSPEHWVKLMMVVYTIQLALGAGIVAWEVYQIGFSMRGYLLYTISFQLFELALSVVIYSLLYKRLRWDWIWYFVLGSISIGHSAIQFIKSSYYLYGGDDWKMANDLFSLLINLGLIILLWKPDIAALFKVNSLTKKISLIIAVIIMGLIIVFSWV